MQRRRFLAAAAGAFAACQSNQEAAPEPASAESAAAPTAHKPVGLELFSVREQLKEDLMGTIAAVADMGYTIVELYSPYFEWTDDYAKQVREHLDKLGVECRSLHSPGRAFEAENRARAITLNKILGSGTVVMASPGKKLDSADGWKQVAATLSQAQEHFAGEGLRAGYHNHASEWEDLGGGQTAMDILAQGTPEGVTLQLDVGTCVEMGMDPVAWIEANPGRIRSLHCKDWAPGEPEQDKGFRVLVGEGVAPWKEIVAAAERVGGVEYYLIEQEGSRFPALETAERCLKNWREITA
ncbi:MAG: sugar phosphate isomerase/epimerase [Acidobacteria bacterium]|nr:sugar phosphate isomerase/epimerase [Acidobacteriota bacterium]